MKKSMIVCLVLVGLLSVDAVSAFLGSYRARDIGETTTDITKATSNIRITDETVEGYTSLRFSDRSTVYITYGDYLDAYYENTTSYYEVKAEYRTRTRAGRITEDITVLITLDPVAEYVTIEAPEFNVTQPLIIRRR